MSKAVHLTPAAIAVLQSLQDACTYNGALERAAVARGAAPIPVTPFHSSVVPPVSVVDYGARLARHGRLADEAVLCGAALVVRYQLATGRRLTEVNVHRLLAAAVVVAVKTTSDFFYSNDHYATVAGVPAAELAVLEARLLGDVSFSTWVAPAELEALAAAALASVPDIFLEGYAADRALLAAAAAPEVSRQRGGTFAAAAAAAVSAPTAYARPEPVAVSSGAAVFSGVAFKAVPFVASPSWQLSASPSVASAAQSGTASCCATPGASASPPMPLAVDTPCPVALVL